MDTERRDLGQPQQHCPCTATTLATSTRPCSGTGTPCVYRGRPRPIGSAYYGLVRSRSPIRPPIFGSHCARVTCPLASGLRFSGTPRPPAKAATARRAPCNRLAQSRCLSKHAASRHAVAADIYSSRGPSSLLQSIGFRLSACGSHNREPIPSPVHPLIRQQHPGHPHHTARTRFGFLLGRASSSVHQSANARSALQSPFSRYTHRVFRHRCTSSARRSPLWGGFSKIAFV